MAGDSSIKAVIVRIDSPGGEVTASDEILRQMMLLSQKKPLVFPCRIWQHPADITWL